MPTRPPVKSCGATKKEVCQIAEEASEATIKRTFALLGVDVTDPAEVEEFRKDLRFGGELRKLAGHGRLAMMAVLAGAMMTALWVGITSGLGNSK